MYVQLSTHCSFPSPRNEFCRAQVHVPMGLCYHTVAQVSSGSLVSDIRLQPCASAYSEYVTTLVFVTSSVGQAFRPVFPNLRNEIVSGTRMA